MQVFHQEADFLEGGKNLLKITSAFIKTPIHNEIVKVMEIV